MVLHTHGYRLDMHGSCLSQQQWSNQWTKHLRGDHESSVKNATGNASNLKMWLRSMRLSLSTADVNSAAMPMASDPIRSEL